MIKRLLLSLPILLLSLSCAAAEDPKEAYTAGTHYDVIAPVVRTADPDKIEVAEFFWYGCGHCYSFEPALQQWKKTLADDVVFVGVPAIWNDKMSLHAAAYYTAETLGVLDTMHDVIFQAMNVDRKRLANQAEIEALFTANGVSAEDFNKTFKSFGVGSQVRQAGSLAKAAKITGTPALVVDGKYHVSARKSGSQADMLKVVNFLIEKERVARGGK